MLFKIVKSQAEGAPGQLEAEFQAKLDGFLEHRLESLLKQPSDNQQERDAMLHPDIFKEDLYLLRCQGWTKQKKRFDMLALDRRGNSVVIELKRDQAPMGVDTQALQYLADISAEKGAAFLDRHLDVSNISDLAQREQERQDRKRQILSQLQVPEDEINRKQRIILIARRFDRTLFSMGEWLASQGIGFRCISYQFYQIGQDKYLTFSVDFDAPAEPVYRIEQRERRTRGPESFWIGLGSGPKARTASGEWWREHLEKGVVSCGFEGTLGDRGTEILRDTLMDGDTVFAYLSGVGAVGYGEVKGKYELGPWTSISGEHPHHRPVIWKAWVDPNHMDAAISAETLRARDDLPAHPIATLARIRPEKAAALKALMDSKVKSEPDKWRSRS
jgi:hypothetical protein